MADVAKRIPKSSPDVIAELRKLAPAEAEDRDAQQAALFRVTQDPALLAPVLQQLKAREPAKRTEAVVKLRYFGLRTAPGELIERLEDADPDAQSWAALTLGEIGDASAAAALTTAAADAKRRTDIRCNAIVSVGNLKAPEATATLERLQSDADPTVRAQAAAALERIKPKDQPAPKK